MRNSSQDQCQIGGAVGLIAAMIVINGTLNASGACASGACGNGGGGSGGLIVLDASDVTINGSARVFAQGGDGGDGGLPGGDGNDGTDPTSPGQAAQSGNGTGDGGDGGAGATTGNGGNGGDDGAAVDDGGGGGGSSGFIITTDPTPPTAPTSMVCPAFSQGSIRVSGIQTVVVGSQSTTLLRSKGSDWLQLRQFGTPT